MATKYYIQYHNADNIGSYPTANVDFESSIDLLTLDPSVKYDSWIYTRKKLVEKAIGQFCFLVVGKTERVKKYYLWSFFRVEKCNVTADGYYNVYGTGYDFAKPILLNDLENFEDFKIFCGNFGIGFQNIDNHIFCKALISYSSPLDSSKISIEKTEEPEELNQELHDDLIYNIPSTLQYQDVLGSFLSAKQIDLLQTLYYFPNSSATAKELARALNYKSYHPANRQIGEIGKIISQQSGITPPTYYRNNGEQPAYFLLIGEYYKDTGWEMWEELQKALENLRLVSNNSVEVDHIERLPTEAFQFEERQLFKEGKVIQVFVNRYERNQKARTTCIKHYGDSCYVCG